MPVTELSIPLFGGFRVTLNPNHAVSNALVVLTSPLCLVLPLPPAALQRLPALENLLLSHNRLEGSLPCDLATPSLAELGLAGARGWADACMPGAAHTVLLRLVFGLCFSWLCFPACLCRHLSARPACPATGHAFLLPTSADEEKRTNINLALFCRRFPTAAVPANQLKGSIPACLVQSPALQELYLAGNDLEGSLPQPPPESKLLIISAYGMVRQ